MYTSILQRAVLGEVDTLAGTTNVTSQMTKPEMYTTTYFQHTSITYHVFDKTATPEVGNVIYAQGLARS